MSVADRSTFKRRLDALGVTVSEGPERACVALIDEAAGDPAVGVALAGEGDEADDSTVSLPDRVETDPTTADLRAAHTGVTRASLGVAEYGSVAIEADSAGTEPISLFVDRHVVVLHEADLVPDMPDAFEWLGPRAREESVDVVFATGPSATADMGGLVHGAHGPKEVHVVLLRGDEADPSEATADDAEGTRGDADE
ncbi:LUD domain-containing protein [Halorubrum sp. AD140]|uniref:LUD domain-containing protein n=1 Tax=Halorubrum sp. AD140 TaxID=3050073 RepID=UPI002ACC8A48|nr:LUD domain-containing protein [Halorubrum sp. AD140]MDZ5811218.1 LUD domain-containing protein [Halorubrum sp. AD140]